MKELKSYINIIDEAISDLGIDPEKTRGNDKGQWNLQRDELMIWVDVWTPEKADKPFFQVLTPIMTLPDEDRKDFYKELLEINNSIFTVSFALHQNYVYLKSIREAEGLTKAEVASSLHYCSYYADYYATRLLDRFGGKKLVNK